MSLSSLKVAELRLRLGALGEDGAGLKKEALVRAIERLTPANVSPVAPAPLATQAPLAAQADPSKQSVADLRSELEALGASAVGKKAELVARLRDERSRASAPGAAAPPPYSALKRQKQDADQAPRVAPVAPPALGPSKGGKRKAAPAPTNAGATHAPAAPAPTGHAAKSSSMKHLVVKGRAAVDAVCPRAADYHVYEADNQTDIYDVLLNQTDISKNSNKFYVIQLLETDSAPHRYFLWTRWGRVGERGQFAMQPVGDRSAAQQLFASKFQDKTRNDWRQRASFNPVPGKYTLIEVDYGADDKPAPDVKLDDKPGNPPDPREPVRPRIDPRVASLVSLVCDVSLMEASMKEIGFDAERMPLGKLKRSTILQGYSVLKELSELIVGPKALQRPASTNSSSHASVGRSGGYRGSTPQCIMDLSNKFYSLIPHVSTDKSGVANRLLRLPAIDTPALLKSKIEMVEALGEIELASRVIDTKGGAFDKHPVDIRYEQLGASLTPIDVGSAEHQLIAQYMRNTHADTHNQYELELEQAYAIIRPGEAEAFRDVGNRMLLWHGSRITNWAGIISQGLRIAPPEAPVTGYMFDKGLYFADMVSKSANYCFTSRSSPTGILLLCDVALGTPYERLQAEYSAASAVAKEKKHSCWGKGSTGPDPQGTISHPLDPSLKLPMGKGKPTGVARSALLYNEYVVYDTRQVRQKYVLKVQFKHR